MGSEMCIRDRHSTSHSTHRRARSRSNADARVDPTRTHAQHARLARQRSSTHMSTLPTINSRPATIRTMRTVSRRLCSLTHARFSHRHRRHALPLHTCSNTTPPKHSPDQNWQGLPPGDPGSLWIATALGSSAAVSALATTARRRQALTPVWSTCCGHSRPCLLYTSPSPRDGLLSRMPSSA